MKRKQIAAFVMAVVLILCAGGAQAAMGGKLPGNIKYGVQVPYENRVYGYSLDVYSRFHMYGDAATELLLAKLNEQDEQGEQLYDIRMWSSPDAKCQLLVQVKQPSCVSFAQEIENAPHYAERMQDRFAPEQQFRQLHDGILRDTPVGQMLEIASSCTVTAEDGSQIPQTEVYYDFYANGYEYIFMVISLGEGTYEAAQQLLDSIAQTISIWQVGL